MQHALFTCTQLWTKVKKCIILTKPWQHTHEHEQYLFKFSCKSMESTPPPPPPLKTEYGWWSVRNNSVYIFPINAHSTFAAQWRDRHYSTLCTAGHSTIINLTFLWPENKKEQREKETWDVDVEILKLPCHTMFQCLNKIIQWYDQWISLNHNPNNESFPNSWLIIFILASNHTKI